MKFVADECISPIVVEALRVAGHEIIDIATLAPTSKDPSVLAIAVEVAGPLITEDLDFGELIFRRKFLSSGVILMRLPANTPEEKAEILVRVIGELAEQLPGAFLVISPTNLRIRRL